MSVMFGVMDLSECLPRSSEFGIDLWVDFEIGGRNMRTPRYVVILSVIFLSACPIAAVTERAEAQQVYLDPAGEIDECLNVDTLWIRFDASIQDVEAAHFKLTYDHTHLVPTAVIPDAGIASNLFLDYTIYPADSVIINLGVLSGNFDGPGRLVGIVLSAGVNIVTTPVGFGRSVLRNSDNQDIPHTTAGAMVQTRCCCRFQGDLDTNGVFSNIQDVVLLVDYIFRHGAVPPADPACPTHRGELNCDEIPNIVDVVRIVEVAFRSGDPKIWICNPCSCAPYPANCP
jgi:hypothetical protein